MDEDGCAYVTGETLSQNYPTGGNPLQNSHSGGRYDSFVSKLSNHGNRLIYSTYIGFTQNPKSRFSYEFGNDIDVDQHGNAYITGSTVAVQAYRTAWMPIGPWHAFVLSLSPSGGMAWTTFLGGKGDSEGFGIAVDPDLNVFITGYTAAGNFPIHNPYQQILSGKNDVFVTKLNAGNLIYSTYLGGSEDESAVDIACDDKGYAYITGTTKSNVNFPIHPSSPRKRLVQRRFGGGNTDAFVVRLK